MSPFVPPVAATPWARDREPRWGRAAAIALALATATMAWAPVDWLRAVFGRDFRALVADTVEVPTPDDTLRLLPVPGRTPATEVPAPPEVAVPSRQVDVEVEPPVESAVESDFVWDPTTPWSASAELLLPAVPDSIARRAALLDALAQGDLDRAFAFLDTTQVTAAQRRLDWMDDYMNHVLRPLFEAEGRAARISNIYQRTVTEAEEDGVQ